MRYGGAAACNAIAVVMAVLWVPGLARVQAADPPPSASLGAGPQTRISLPQAVVLGVVEGLTEYLPVSSTGHLILAGYWMGLARPTQEPGAFGGHKLEKAPAIDAYEIVIQLGAILAVLGLYRKRVAEMIHGLAGRSGPGLRLAMMLLVAFLPAAVVGLALHKKIEEHLFGPMPVVVALAAGGVLMIVVEHFFWTRRRKRIGQSAASGWTGIETMMFWQAGAIGAAQCLSLWPGTSRSMITILAGLVVGLDMVAAAEFSFLLALPTLGAATLYSAYKQWDGLMQSAGPAGLVVGLVVSGVVAALAVEWFVHWLTRHGLLPFGVYRIALALVLMLYFLG
jgi:undecaprenyl-diphosphatase